ncbi:hypothetical protein TWF730_000119 [Orbilia blumenaviensis]|uniref:Rhodopsin domain-containing protein n=1 Tax=Orbilia blumenaviensis TaxID=1796055 RepID=A0AAV9VKK4_9PEZI
MDPLYSLALQTIRMSMLAFYLRLSADPKFRKVVYWSMAITWLIFLTLLFIFEFQCRPPWKAWDLTVAYNNLWDKYCLDRWALSWTWAVFAILADCWVLVLPLKMLMALRISPKERVVVLCIFGIGFMACAASIVRIPALKVLTESPDPLWDQFNVSVTSVVEWNFSVMAACCPALKPLAGRWFPSLMARLSQGSSAWGGGRTGRAFRTKSDASKMEHGDSTTAVSESSSPITPRSPAKYRRFSMFVPGGRLNEMGMAPQMPPGERFGWRRLVGFLGRRESVAKQEINAVPVSEIGRTSLNGPNIGFWRNKDSSMDMTNNDYCVNASHTHQLPQHDWKKSRLSSVGSDDIPP